MDRKEKVRRIYQESMIGHRYAASSDVRMVYFYKEAAAKAASIKVAAQLTICRRGVPHEGSNAK